MKITAKLAYRQIKLHRSRTLWTLTGIMLSTALITAVCSLAASAYALLTDLQSGNHAALILLLIPVGILSAIIVSMAVIVISNAFRVSANERRTQFGILKSTGTTTEQITSIVMYESIFLSGAGIPAGIIAGLGMTFAGIQIVNRFISEINSLAHIMIRDFYIAVDFIIAWQAIATAILISFSTVLLSAWMPARKASKISAIDSIRNTNEITVTAGSLRTNRLIQKCFGIEGVLAAQNMKRSRRNFRASITALTIGIILFINLESVRGQADALLTLIHSYSSADSIMVDYTSSYENITNKTTGNEETVITAPISTQVSDRITEKLLEYENASLFGVGYDSTTYTANVPSGMISQEMMTTVYPSEENPLHEADVDILTLDHEHYALLCEQAGVPLGSNILINHYSHNDNGYATALTPFKPDIPSLQLTKADGSFWDIELHGQITAENIPGELLYPNAPVIRVIVPESEVRIYNWLVTADNPDDFITYANAVMDEIFPVHRDAAYMELGFTTRTYLIQDYMKIMNIPINLAVTFVYLFVLLLTLIGLTSIISTMSTNVQVRSREFAVLQSIGMTHRGLKRTLSFESLIYSAKALIIGLPLAVILTYLINLPIRSIFPIPYQFPWLSAICCIAVVFIITWSTMRYSSTQVYKKNIIETIRMEK